MIPRVQQAFNVEVEAADEWAAVRAVADKAIETLGPRQADKIEMVELERLGEGQFLIALRGELMSMSQFAYELGIALVN